MNNIECIRAAKRIVVKVGTSTLAHPTGMINIRAIEGLVKVLSDLKNAGREVVLVTSGAIGVGMGKIKLKERPSDTPSKQALAAVGQCELMYAYDKLFQKHNHVVAQILLTGDILDSPKRKANVVNTFERLLEMGAIPVINENDTVSVEEIEFGDNDTLSAIVARLCSADALIILTDIDGLYDKDPHAHPDACLIPHVSEITDEIRALAGGRGSTLGTGGMMTKISAASLALEKDIPVVIANGHDPDVLYDLTDGKQAGTLFCPERLLSRT